MHNIKDTIAAYWTLLDNSSSRTCWLTLASIIIIGFLLRFYSLYVGHAYTYFAINDEVTALNYALGFLAGEKQMLYLGSPALNQGQIPGPLWTMLVAGLYKLGGNSAEGAIFGMILLNTFVIYLVYRLANAFMPNRYAILSSLLYSLSPWVIYYSAGLYNPIPLALLGALLFLALWKTTQTKNSRAIFWVCILAASIPQFHMIGVFYYPAIFLLLYISPATLNRRWFIIGLIAGFTLYLPYLIGELSTGWDNTQQILISNSDFSFGILKILTIPIAMLANHPGQWAGYSFDDFKYFGDAYFGSYILLLIVNCISLVIAITFVTSFSKCFFKSLSAAGLHIKESYKQHSAVIFIGILLITPLLLYTLTGRNYTTRYSILIFSLLFLLPSLFLSRLKSHKIKQLVCYTLTLLVGFNLYLVLAFYYHSNIQIANSDTLIPTFRRLSNIYKDLRSAVDSNTRITVKINGDTTHLDKYRQISSNATADYINTMEAYNTIHGTAKRRLIYYLQNANTEASDSNQIVYQKNGIIFSQ